MQALWQATGLVSDIRVRVETIGVKYAPEAIEAAVIVLPLRYSRPYFAPTRPQPLLPVNYCFTLLGSACDVAAPA